MNVIIVMNNSVSQTEIDKVTERLADLGFDSHISKGTTKTIIGAIGENKQDALIAMEAFPFVEKIVPISQPFKLVSREFQGQDSTISIGARDPVQVGGDHFTVFAGPCAVEDQDCVTEIAKSVKRSGAQFLRGGAFKPRTSPYSFQGKGEQGLKILKEAGEQTGLKIVTEVMDPRQVELVTRYADVLQIGARNMQNFELLKEIGESNHPVLLKRGMSATIEEWLMAAEYITSRGNYKVILCERGIRTFEKATRNTLDLSAVPLAKQWSHLPVVVDPSHGTGKWKLVPAMSKAALAAGADGLIIEVHPTPETAYSDGPQTLTLSNFEKLMSELHQLAPHFGKNIERTSENVS